MNLDYNSFITNELTNGIERIANILVEETIQIISNSLDTLIELIKEMISDFLKDFNNEIKELMRICELIKLSIPDMSVSLNSFDYIPQAPPIKDKTIKEIAVENFHYNMNRYKNSKLIKLIKRKSPAFIETLVFEIIIYLIFKALGMQ